MKLNSRVLIACLVLGLLFACFGSLFALEYFAPAPSSQFFIWKVDALLGGYSALWMNPISAALLTVFPLNSLLFSLSYLSILALPPLLIVRRGKSSESFPALFFSFSFLTLCFGPSLSLLSLVLGYFFLHEILKVEELEANKKLSWLGASILLLFWGDVLALLCLFAFVFRYNRHSRTLLLSLLATGLLVSCFRPVPETPELPEGARLQIERMEFLTGTDSYTSSSPGLQLIDRASLRKVIVLPLLIFALVVLASKEKSLLWAVLVLLLDSSLFPEWVSLLAPLYNLERLIPGQVYAPLLIPFFVLALASLSVSMPKLPGAFRSRLGGSILFSLAVFSLITGPLIVMSSDFPLWAKVSKVRDGKLRFASDIQADFVGSAVDCAWETHDLRPFVREVRSSVREEELRSFMADEEQVWSATADERASFELELSQPLTLERLLIKTPVTDFPGGFRLELLSRCDSESPDEIIDYPNWHGTLCQSSPAYYLQESEIHVDITSSQAISCIRFKRTKANAFFDFRLSELRFRGS